MPENIDNSNENNNKVVNNVSEEVGYQPFGTAPQGYDPTINKYVGNGKKINQETGEEEDSATKKTLKTAAIVAGTYFGGEAGMEAAEKISDSEAGGNVLGKVADVADKIPGIEQLSEEIDESGVNEAVGGAAKAVTSFKKKDIKGTIEGVKEAKKGAKKSKKLQKKITKKIIIFALPSVIFFTILIAIISAFGNGNLNVFATSFETRDDTGGESGGEGGDIDPGDYGLIIPGEHYSKEQLEKLLKVASSQLGVIQGTDAWKKYNVTGGPHYEQWCADFVSWCLKQANIQMAYSASCGTLMDNAINSKTWTYEGSGYIPKPGDLVIFHWNGSQHAHVGIVYGSSGNEIYTIEGNTNDTAGHSSIVTTKKRSRSVITGFIVM